MIIYKFFLRDPINGDIFLGALPERRRNLKRITNESTINWGRKYFGHNGEDEDIFFVRTVLEESEKQYTRMTLQIEEEDISKGRRKTIFDTYAGRARQKVFG